MISGVRRLICAAAMTAATLESAPTSAAGQETRLTKGPYVTGLSSTGADVRFELDRPSRATLTVARAEPSDAGDAAPAPRTFESRDATDMHVLRASGLLPETRYGYSVRAGGAPVGDGWFSTAPLPDADSPVTFLVYGDDRSDPVAHAAIARAMTPIAAAFLVNTGDMVENGGDADTWQTFFSVEAPLLRDHPLFVAIGNHELVDDSAGANFARYFGFPDDSGVLHPYGTVRFGIVRLFFLNAFHEWESGDERSWLVRSLQASDTEAGLRWRIAVAHQGPWSAGPHGGSARLVEAQIPQLLAAHHVELFVSGHDHIYERGEGRSLRYIVSGGGGAPLYRVERAEGTTLKAESTYHFVEVRATSSELTVIAHRLDGTVLDRCGLSHAGWDCDPVADAATPVAAKAQSRARQTASRCGCRVCGGEGGTWWAGTRADSASVALGVLLAVLRRRRG